MSEVVEAPRRRRRWPVVVLAVVVFVVIAVALAPTLLSGFVAGRVSDGFAADHKGRLELGGLDLAWFSRQKVESARLVDPQGAEVARASVELPSLFALATGGGKQIGVVEVDASAQLVADDDGTTNLERALEETEDAKRRASEPKEPSEPTDLGALLAELDVDLEVRIAKVVWSDARTRALGKPFELADVVAKVAAKPGEPLALTLDGVLASEGNVPLTAKATVADLFAGAEINPNARFELAADVKSLPSGLVDALAAQGGLVSALFGERMSVTAAGAGTLDAGTLDARVAGDAGTLDVACELRGGELGLAEGKQIALRSTPDAARLEQALASKLPADLAVKRRGGGEIALVVTRLDVKLAELLEGQVDAAGMLEKALAQADFALSAQLGGWSVAPAALALDEPIAIDALALEAESSPGGALRAQLTSSVARAELRGALKDGVWRGEADKALVASLDLTPKLAQALAKRFAPENAELELPAKVDIVVRELEIPVRAVLEGGDAAAKLVEGLRAKVEVRADSLHYTDKSNAAAEKRAELSNIEVALHAGPNGGKTPIVVIVKSALKPAGNLELELTHPDARALVASPADQGSGSIPLRVVARGLSTAWLETWAGGELGLAQELGPSLDVELDARAELPKTAAATLELKGKAASPKGSAQFTANASIEKARELDAQLAAGAFPVANVSFSVVDDGLVYAFLPEASSADARELVGAKFSGSLRTEATRLHATVRAERIALDAAAKIADRELRMHGDDALSLTVKPTPALLARRAAESVPAGAKLAFASESPELTLSVRELTLPLDAWMPAEGKVPASLADVVRGAAAQLDIALPSLRYEQPALTAGAPATPIDVEALAVSVTLTPAQPAVAKVTGRVAGEKGGALKLDASCGDPGAFLDDDPALPPLDLKADVAGLPTALVDTLAAQDGLLVDTLGPVLDLSVAGRYPSPPEEPLRATMKSEHASVDLVALLEAQTVVAEGTQGLNATLPLTPLFSKRVVGNLVPLLVNATKPAGAEPLSLSVSNFSLPLDGDLRKLDGTVQLNLGEIAYDLLPGLSDALAAAGFADIAQKRFTLEPLTIGIKAGVARYDRLPLRIGGKEVVFKGSFDLATKELGLATNLPLAALGSKVSSELEKVREYLDPNLVVPLELKGQWNKPRISLGKDFVDKVVKDAAKNAAKKGLLDLLGKELEKKKKDGDG